MRKIFIFTVLLLLFASCEKDDICPENSPKTPEARVEFAANINGLKQRVNLQDFKVWGVKNGIAGSRINTTASGSYVLLPLDFSEEKTEFLFEASGMQGRFSISYRPELQFVSKACGYRHIYYDLSAENIDAAFIEEIVVVDSPLITNAKRALTLYLETQQ